MDSHISFFGSFVIHHFEDILVVDFVSFEIGQKPFDDFRATITDHVFNRYIKFHDSRAYQITVHLSSPISWSMLSRLALASIETKICRKSADLRTLFSRFSEVSPFPSYNILAEVWGVSSKISSGEKQPFISVGIV